MTRRNMFIAGAVAGLILVLWYLLLWSPRKADLSEARDRRAQAEALRGELASRVSRLRAAQKDEPIKRAQLEALRTTLPDEPNLAAFILDTNDAASKAGIDFISIAPSEPSASSIVGAPVATQTAVTTPAVPGEAPAATAAAPVLPAEVKLQLQISGGYFQVLDFLNRVNEMPRLVVTDGLTISSDDKAKLTVGVTARMFMHSLPVGFGGVPVTPASPPAATNVTVPGSSTPPPTATAAPAAPATSGARS